MKKILLLVLIFTSVKINAQTWVTLPDTNFANSISWTIPAAVNGHQLDISSPLVTTLDYLSVGGGISDLTGIEYFTSLTRLNCGSNHLSTLPPLPNTLVELKIYHNQFTVLPTLPPSIRILDFSNNPIAVIPTLPDQLTYLVCGNTLITSLPELPDSLEILYCNSNSISQIPDLPLTLTELVCSYCSLTCLPPLPPSLRNLVCSYNSITQLPIIPSQLTRLICNNNQITCLPTLPNTIPRNRWIGTPHVPMMEINLDLSDNPWTCIPNYIDAMSSSPDGQFMPLPPICNNGDPNNCSYSCAPVSIGELTNLNTDLYPNPNHGIFTIDTKSDFCLNIFDITGKLILHQLVNGKSEINASNLSNGIYSITLSSEKGTLNKKLIIAR